MKGYRSKPWHHIQLPVEVATAFNLGHLDAAELWAINLLTQSPTSVAMAFRRLELWVEEELYRQQECARSKKILTKIIEVSDRAISWRSRWYALLVANRLLVVAAREDGDQETFARAVIGHAEAAMHVYADPLKRMQILSSAIIELRSTGDAYSELLEEMLQRQERGLVQLRADVLKGQLYQGKWNYFRFGVMREKGDSDWDLDWYYGDPIQLEMQQSWLSMDSVEHLLERSEQEW